MFGESITPQWLAGVFDQGSGLGIYKRYGPKDRLQYILQVVITKNDEMFCQWLACDLDGSLSIHEKTVSVTWTSAKAQTFLEMIAPYVILKKEDVELALAFRKELRGIGKGGAPPEYWEKLEGYARRMKEIKQERKGRRLSI